MWCLKDLSEFSPQSHCAKKKKIRVEPNNKSVLQHFGRAKFSKLLNFFVLLKPISRPRRRMGTGQLSKDHTDLPIGVGTHIEAF